MAKHNFNFDDAVTVIEFFKQNKIAKGDRKFLCKNCTAEDGSIFPAVGFADGETLDDGRPSYQWFVASSTITESEGIEDKEDLKAFMRKHKEDLLLLEPVDGLKFGICFLAGGAEDWEDEW